MKQLLYVANWKMFFSFKQARGWLETNQKLLNCSNLVLCPSFELLAYTAEYARKNNLLLGAQDCSEHGLGAYTGQVSAQSLAELGCSYCIIGHSEQRAHLTNTIIYNKLTQLAAHTITPIVCISQVTGKQIEPIQQFIKKYQIKPLYIAYEPLSAIGTGLIASQEDIISTLNQLRASIGSSQVKFLYGGSVAPDNCASLKLIEDLDGFLIGSASTTIDTLLGIIRA
jgi:triosephosphate isomerase